MIVDDPNSPNRIYPNSRFKLLSPNRLAYGPELYARSTCLHNSIIDIDETAGGFIAEGSGGVSRRGTFFKNGVRVDGVIKLILKNSSSYGELNEVKIALEVQRVVPDYVIETNILERCQILDSKILPDRVNRFNNLLLIGMERGIDSVHNQISRTSNLKKLIQQSFKACYEFNCAGFFHRDIKPANMVVVERKGKQKVVLIDFGKTVYMSQVQNQTTGRYKQYTTNPPFDAMYIGLFFLMYVNDLKYLNNNDLLIITTYIFKKLQRYFEILKVLEPKFVDINVNIFHHYRLDEPLDTFLRYRSNTIRPDAHNYLKKHHNAVNFYRSIFNNALIRGFTNTEAGFQLLKNSSDVAHLAPVKRAGKTKLTSKDNDDINTICDPYEKMHKDIANNVYMEELLRVKELSEKERDPSIFKNYKKTKYAAVCRMAEAMRTYIKIYKTYTKGFEQYMKKENPADWTSKRTRSIVHYQEVYGMVYNGNDIVTVI